MELFGGGNSRQYGAYLPIFEVANVSKTFGGLATYTKEVGKAFDLLWIFLMQAFVHRVTSDGAGISKLQHRSMQDSKPGSKLQLAAARRLCMAGW